MQALHITMFDNKPRDVVSPPTVGGGTTYEVSLQKEKKKLRKQNLVLKRPRYLVAQKWA